jgi:hypothetical protein
MGMFSSRTYKQQTSRSIFTLHNVAVLRIVIFSFYDITLFVALITSIIRLRVLTLVIYQYK